MCIEFLYAGRKVFFFSISILFLSSNHSFSSQDRLFTAINDSSTLVYRIHLLKDSLLLYEPVKVDIWVKNVSELPVKSNFTPLFGWKIIDDSGREYRSSIIVYPGTSIINPGDSTGGRTDFGGYTIISEEGFTYFPERNYRLFYWLFGDSIPPLTFKVKKPQGEEVEALKHFLKSFPPTIREGVKLPREEYKKLHRDLTVNMVKFADQFPKSVYAPQALSIAAGVAGGVTEDKELAYQLHSRILKEYSDPYKQCIFFFQEYYESKRDQNGFKQELEKIITTSSDSILIGQAKRYLKGMEDKR